MNDEQIYDFFAGIREANGSLIRIVNSLESVDNDGLPTGVVNPLLSVGEKLEENNEKLESISFELYRIAEALEDIANALNHRDKGDAQ